MKTRPVFSDLSIKGKLIFMSVAISGVALVMSTLAFGINNVVTAKHALLERLSTQATIVGANSASALLFEDQPAAQRTLSALAAESPITAAGIYSKDLVLFASYTRSDIGIRILPKKLVQSRHAPDSSHFEVLRPIIYDGESIGTIYLQADLTTLYAQLRYQAIVVAIVLLISFSVIVALSSRLQSRISTPILRLAQTAKIISTNKDYGIRVQERRHDELGTLMDAFNEMLAEIQDRDGKLEQRASELLKLNEQLKYQAYHDTLTGLPNRELFIDRLTQAIGHYHRRQKPLVVLFLDLDRFKNINDTLGHAVGDCLINMVAERLIGLVRKDDTVARLGGDEFTILLSSVSSSEDAGEVANKLNTGLEQPFRCLGHELHTTSSIGMAVCPNDGQDAETLMRNADTAMYHVKGLGGNSYGYFDPDMHERSLKRLEMENSLRRALSREEFIVHYQPMCEIGERRIVGAEALIRWARPDTGLVPPADFIPILEETGLIVSVGEWILHTVCTQAKAWNETQAAPIKASVNLSSRQLRGRNPALMVQQILDETGFAAEYLTLEITESMLMEDAEEAVKHLRDLSAMGVSLAIDDFGTGYSSLSYLKRLPIDAVKIDRSFVQDITRDPDDAAIVEATIAMARALNLQVVAEGVETEDQFAYLRNCGCDIVQGYLFDRPLPEEQLVSRLSMQQTLDHSP